MAQTFSEIKLFQVKPNNLDMFETLITDIAEEQRKRPGALTIKYFKRFYTIDGVELGEPPRELTRIVKCVKYYSYWEFDTKENYGKATRRFFENHLKPIQKLLISPFDISCGDTIA